MTNQLKLIVYAYLIYFGCLSHFDGKLNIKVLAVEISNPSKGLKGSLLLNNLKNAVTEIMSAIFIKPH